jgi:hypothetical protein
LGNAGRVAQVQERHPTVVSSASDPAGQRHRPAGVFGAELTRVLAAKHESRAPSSEHGLVAVRSYGTAGPGSNGLQQCQLRPLAS